MDITILSGCSILSIIPFYLPVTTSFIPDYWFFSAIRVSSSHVITDPLFLKLDNGQKPSVGRTCPVCFHLEQRLAYARMNFGGYNLKDHKSMDS
jgi:hypothetical protein